MTALEQLLELVPVSHVAKEAVVQRLLEPHRKYHNLDHVVEMWQWHNTYNRGRFEDISHQMVVASFCLYHDAIYDPEAKDGERRSADLWSRDAATSTLMYGLVDAVKEMIVASADHFRPSIFRIPSCLLDQCRDWCLNLDLLRLGTPVDEFTQHGLNIRAEYTHLNDAQWVKASAEFRSKVMAQPTIFRFPEFATFEVQARHNLANALVNDWKALGYLERRVW